MKKKIIIKTKYQKTALRFSNKITYYQNPLIPVILKDPITNKTTKFARKFILDTGACISIINPIYEHFLKDLKADRNIQIQYGAGKPKELPIYNIIFVFKKQEIKSTVAYDKNGKHLLLGHYDFIENFSYTLFDSLTHSSKLVKT